LSTGRLGLEEIDVFAMQPLENLLVEKKPYET
jgi:hypothetical protein